MVTSNSNSAVLVFGGGGHAKVVIDVLERQRRFAIAGIVDPYLSQPTCMGYPVLKASLAEIGVNQGIIAVGDNRNRSVIAEKILSEAPGFDFVTAIHPSAQVGRDVEIGPGTVVMAGACINPGTRVGKHCIINTRASIDHDNKIGDFASVAPGATTGGNVILGNFAALGLGASCVHRIEIGNHAVIGAGAVVVKNMPSSVVAYGVPCQVIRQRKADDTYL